MRVTLAIVLVLSALTVPAMVSANTIFKKGNWVLNDAGNVCTASTSGYLNRNVYALTVVLDKSGLRPIEVFLLPAKSPTTVKLFQTQLADGRIYSFTAMPTAADGRDSFWNIPNDTAALLATMRNGNQLNVHPVIGERGVLPLSLTGATATLAEMEKRCLQSNVLNSADFERRFVPAQAASLNASLLTPDLSNYLNAEIATAVAAYRAILAIEAELSAIEAKYAALTRELGALNQDLVVQNQSLLKYTSARDGAVSAIAQAQADISKLQAAIAATQIQLNDAQLVYNNATAALAPLVPRHDALLAQLNRLRDNTSNAVASLDNIERAIRTKNQQINDLESEQRSLWSQQPVLHAQTQQALRDRENADRMVRNFDVQNEVAIRQQGDPQLRQIDQDIASLQQALRQSAEQVRQAEQSKQRAEQELQQCMNAIVIGPGPVDPGPIAPPPPPDCTAQRQALQQANQALDQIQNAQRQREQALNNRMEERNQAVARIQNQVDSEYAQLQQNADWANREYNQAEAQESALETRLLAIQNELPQRNSELNGLTQRRLTAQDALSRARQNQSTAQSAYDSYKASVNYDSLKADVDTAAANVSTLASSIARSNSQIAANQRKINAQTLLQNSMQVKIDAANLKISQDQTRADQLHLLLQPYDSEKAAVLVRLNAAQQAFDAIKADFAAHLPQ